MYFIFVVYIKIWAIFIPLYLSIFSVFYYNKKLLTIWYKIYYFYGVNTMYAFQYIAFSNVTWVDVICIKHDFVTLNKHTYITV